jgi:hypothetical protein
VANEKLIYTESFEADEDLTAAQYHGVDISADGKVELHDATTDYPAGVLLNKPDDTEEALVLVIGRCPVVAAEELTYNDLIYFDASGHAAVFTPATDITKYCVGKIVRGCAAAGEMAEAIIDCANPMKGAAST